MKVYVLERGVYEQRYVGGVYATPELAMAAAEGKWTKTTWSVDAPKRDWDNGPWVSWDNDRDWDEAATVREYDLVDAGESKAPDMTRRQVYRPSDGGWDYIVEDAGT